MCQYIHHKPSSISQCPQGCSLSLHHRLTVCCPVVPVNKETDTQNNCLFLPSSHSQTGRTGTIFWPRLWLEGSGLRFVREECVIHSWNTGFINVLASHLKPRMFPLSVTVRRASSLQLSTVSVNDYRADLDLAAALFKTRLVYAVQTSRSSSTAVRPRQWQKLLKPPSVSPVSVRT